LSQSARRRIILTADDFGLHQAVNEAVERGYREGVLTTASLMMGEVATEDAINRARRLPGLRVGLHVALSDATPVLPADEIPDLVDARGRFVSNMVRAGARFFFLPHVRRQLAAEIRAQFQAFANTGLSLDHANAHKHFHLHPTVLGLMLAIGWEFGLRAVRLPREPLLAGLRISRRGAGARLGWAVFLAPWMALMKARLKRAGVAHNDALFGLSASGHMEETALLAILGGLPSGVSEVYFHPATQDAVSENMADYAQQAELAALTSASVSAALAHEDIESVAFTDLLA
jgi:hopanoid biosynthesis associated protein HpnK